MGLIVLKAFNNLYEAQFLMSKLDEQNVECFLIEENSIFGNFQISSQEKFLIKILSEDFNKAEKIYNELNKKPYLDKNDKEIVCPNCGSINILLKYREPKGLRKFANYFGPFQFYYNTKNECIECGKAF